MATDVKRPGGKGKSASTGLEELSYDELLALAEQKKTEQIDDLKRQREEVLAQLKRINEELARLGERARTPVAALNGGGTPRRSGQRRKPPQWYKERVVECLRRSTDNTAGTGDIAEYITEAGGSKNTLTQQILGQMIQDGSITREGRGQYRLPD